MIYLTGDVHSKNLSSSERKVVKSEIEAAERYLEILKKNKIACTLFINGICLKKEKKDFKRLLNYDVEIGGHTYNNFEGMNIIKSYLYRKIWGGVYGPSFFQKKDIKKTKEAFEKEGLKMISWRTHAFGSNNKTFEILSKKGIKYVSDLLGKLPPFYDKKNKIFHIPINIPVDSNTFSYGKLTPENRDPFASCTKGRIFPEEWFEILKKRIKENEKKGIPSILLIHPSTMAFLDNFSLFKKIAKFLSKYKTAKISEFRI